MPDLSPPLVVVAGSILLTGAVTYWLSSRLHKQQKPTKKFVHIAFRHPKARYWHDRFEEVGVPCWKGPKGLRFRVSVTPEEFASHHRLRNNLVAILYLGLNTVYDPDTKDDEADAREQLALVPLDLGHHPTRVVPRLA